MRLLSFLLPDFDDVLHLKNKLLQDVGLLLRNLLRVNFIQGALLADMLLDFHLKELGLVLATQLTLLNLRHFK